MIILCDTSSIFLLLRIAPSMFTDPTYECVTIPEIWSEVFTTQKFKEKYPWRNDYKNRSKALAYSKYKTSLFDKYLKSIRLLLNVGVINEETGQLIDLSSEDCALLACALANDFKISSGDKNLVLFGKQEFPDFFKGNLSALEIVNLWLEKGLFMWDDKMHAFVADWKKQGEAPQPRTAIQRFKDLTNKDYPGT